MSSRRITGRQAIYLIRDLQNEDDMKVTYVFKCPEDDEERATFDQAYKMSALIRDLQAELRSVCKHGEPTERDNYWQDKLYALINEYELQGF